MSTTGIPYADVVWNPVTGCSHESPGCEHCWAEAVAKRFAGRNGFPDWRPWTMPNAKHNITLHLERLDKPKHWRRPRVVFVDSMTDLFHPEIPDEFILDVFRIMAGPAARHHTYLVFTKRPQRMLAMTEAITRRTFAVGSPEHPNPLETWPANIWPIVSVEDQRRANERIPVLLKIPASIHGVSCEPLLEPVDLSPYLYRRCECGNVGLAGSASPCLKCGRNVWSKSLSWVIIGGETGIGFRELPLESARIMRLQCWAAGVACWVKQDSGPYPGNQGRFTAQEWALKQRPAIAGGAKGRLMSA